MVYTLFSKNRVTGRSVCKAALLLVSMALPLGANAQLSAYLEGGASQLQGSPAGGILYGGTGGLTLDGPKLGVTVLSADLQVRDVVNGGQRLVGLAVGPRFSFPLKKLKLTPYAEFMVGFARYRASTAPGAQNTTDDQWQANIGASRQLSSRFDVVADYSYAQYGANFGEYHPKSYSAGVVFHFVRR